MNSDTGMMTDPRSIKRANALGDMHDALQAALHAMTKFLALADLSIPEVKAKAEAMALRMTQLIDIAESTFRNPNFGRARKPKFRNDGPVAMVEEVVGGGVRLYIHGVLIRSVGFNEAPAVRRLRDMVNEAALAEAA